MTDFGTILKTLIEEAVESGIRRALNGHATLGQAQLVSVNATANRLGLSTREVYNMLSNGELSYVTHGKRKLVDSRAIDGWIAEHLTSLETQ